MNREQQLTNYLSSFARLYGYVRYFHPSNEAERIEWNKFASYGINRILNMKNDNEYINYIQALFSKFTVGFKYSKNKINLEQLSNDLTPTNVSEFKTSHWVHFGLNESFGVYFNKRTNNSYRIRKLANFKYSRGVITFKDLNISATTKEIILRISIRGIPKVNENIGILLIQGKNQHYLDDSKINSKETFKEIELKTSIDNLDEFDLNLFVIDYEYIEIASIEIWESANNIRTLLKSWDMPSKIDHLTFFEYNENRIPNTKFSIKNYKTFNVLRIEKDSSDSNYTRGYFKEIKDVKLEYPKYISYTDFNGYNVVIPRVLYVKNCQTTPILDIDKVNQLNKELNKIDIEDDTELYNRLATVVMYWNNLEHFYPYWDYIEEDIDDALISKDKQSKYRRKLLENSILETIKSKDLADLNNVINKINSVIKDGHAGIINREINMQILPMYIILVEGKWIVKTSKTNEVPIGSELIKIEGKDVAKQLGEVAHLYNKATPQHTNIMLVPSYICSLKQDKVSLQFRYNDEIIDFIFDRKKDYTKANNFDKVKEYDNGTIYLDINRGKLNDADIEELLPKLLKASNIVLDIRGYPGIGLSLLQHFQTKACPWSSKDIALVLNPHGHNDYSIPYFHNSLKPPLEPHINAKIIALSSSHSISYCESFISYLKYNNLAKIVGEQTAGTTGDVVPGMYPCKTSIHFTGMRVVNPDGTRFHGVGIIPDLEVKLTVQGISDGRDEVLEAALKLCNS